MFNYYFFDDDYLSIISGTYPDCQMRNEYHLQTIIYDLFVYACVIVLHFILQGGRVIHPVEIDFLNLDIFLFSGRKQIEDQNLAQDQRIR